MAVHIYTQTIHRTTQITTNVEECWPCPVFCEFYTGICLTTEEKARKNLSQGKKNLSQGKKNLSRVKKNLNQSTVYILPKRPHITKPTQTHALQNTYLYSRCVFHGIPHCLMYVLYLLFVPTHALTHLKKTSTYVNI